MKDFFRNIFQLLHSNKFEEIKKDYLLDMISFDNIKEEEYGDTLLHYFFRQFEPNELLPVSALEFLIKCFFRIDNVNNENKTAVHILLEKHPDAFDHFQCFIKSGIPLFEKKGDTLSIFEFIFFRDNSLIFQCLMANLNLDYIREFCYEKSLSLSMKYESISILLILMNYQPFHLNVLFQEFLDQLYVPTDDDDENSANSQFFLSIKNSKKRIFQKIFDVYPNYKFITLEMLYHCTDTSFCLYLSKYIKDGEYSKISIQNDQKISPEIFNLVNDINSNVYGSRTIIHQKIKSKMIVDNTNIVKSKNSKEKKNSNSKNKEIKEEKKDGEEKKIDFIKQIPAIMYDSLDYSGNTPLYYAIKTRQYKVAKYLLKFGNCDFCHLGNKSTPLHLAVKGRPEILKKMLSYVKKKKYKNFVFDINVKDRNQSTPLLAPFFESTKSHDQSDIDPICLRLIIENGADITACDAQGNNILFYVFEHYYDLQSDEFVRFILSKENLTINEEGIKKLLIQIYDQKDQKLIGLFHEKFDVEPELLKIIFSKCKDPKIESLCSLLKKKGKQNDFFFECLKTGNEKVFNSMLNTIDNLLFFIDSDDDNNNALFVLANSYFNSKIYITQIVVTIFKLIIENKRNDFLKTQSKENGDNFLHLAIRRRNNLLIDIMLDIYQKKENKIFQYLPENREDIWSMVNELFYQKNNDEKNKQNPIELGRFLISSFQNIFSSDFFDIFDKKPSYNELENYLKKFQNPNIVKNNEPLIMKYVKYEKFDEEEMLKILELFNSYDCDFILNNDEEFVSLILMKKYYFKAIDFLLNHRGLGKYSANLMDIIQDSEKAVDILKRYNDSKNCLYVIKLFNDKFENSEEITYLKDDLQKDEFIKKCIENSEDIEKVTKILSDFSKVKFLNDFINNPRNFELVKEIINDHSNLTNVWDVIESNQKADLIVDLIDDQNKKKELNNTIYDFDLDKEKKILLDVDRFDKIISKKIIKFAKYYDAFKNLIKYKQYIDSIQEKILSTIQQNAEFSDLDKKYWTILPTIRQFSTFNEHSKMIIESFSKILLFETPIEKFFDSFELFFEGLYGPLFTQMLSIQKDLPDTQIEADGIKGAFMSVTSFFAAYHKNIQDLIKYNLNESMAKKLTISKKKCHEITDKIQVYSPQYTEFKDIIKNRKIVYDIEFDISQLSAKLYQVYVYIVDSNIEYFTSPEIKLKEFYLICSDEVILVASIDSGEVHFLFQQQISQVFCDVIFNDFESRLKLFTREGMIEFKQIDLGGDKWKILKNIGELMIQKKLKKLNAKFVNEWNQLGNSNDTIKIAISHVDEKTLHVIKFHLRVKSNEVIDDVKKNALEQIQNLYKNDQKMMLYSISKF